ncbi:hypothetical protein [Schlesneria sp. DSM 10557]|uniref:hypothetical protein n=1 Tax=Schlesneria sp. DSM 10557 TaxID=3044399 RepID=UPI00359F2005
MTGTARLASLRKLLCCVLGSSAFVVGYAGYGADPLPEFEPFIEIVGGDDLVAESSEIGDALDRLADIPSPSGETDSKSSSESSAFAGRPVHRPLSDVKATIAPPAGLLPKSKPVRDLDESVDLIFDGTDRPWAYTCFHWEAPATRSLPLLFEEPNLERLGYAYGFCDYGICEEEPRRGQRLQALVSFVHFFGRVPFIPYMAGVHPLTEPYYTLGVDRPGSPVPYRKHIIPQSLRGTLYQAGAAVGAVFIIP